MIYRVVSATMMLYALSQPAAALHVGLSGRPTVPQRVPAVQLAEATTTNVDTSTMAGVVVPTGENCGCAEEQGVLMNAVRVTGRTLRDTVLADPSGGRTALKDVIGDEGKAVVVFLRHLG
jgi:hypothetical protein